MKPSKRHPLIMGTIILTITGLISRIMGFYYRIYLTRLFGEEGMGIYQLLNPVLALAFSLTAAGYQTAISKLVAEKHTGESDNSFRPVLVGLSISLPLSLACNAFLFGLADFIGSVLLSEPRTVPMIRILSFSIPLCAVHSCINGYFYGKKKTAVPAAAQLLEQLARVGCVYGISAYAISKGGHPTINVAVLGLTVGEFFSMVITVAAIYSCYAKESVPSAKRSVLLTGRSALPTKKSSPPAKLSALPTGKSALSNAKSALRPASGRLTNVYRGVLSMALPLTANRLVLNLLQSVESVSIPTQLKAYGYDTAAALSVYGVLTGMAMPLIFFPNALTSSVAVLLLPLVSENYSKGDIPAVRSAILRTLKFCALLGGACMLLFCLCGRLLGNFLFHSELAGHFITTLGFICPFIYMDTTLSSILQGLGKAGSIFLMNILSLLVRLCFIFFTVPTLGITGYLWGLLASQLLQSVLYLSCLFRFLKKT